MHRWLRDFSYYGRVAKELIFPRRCAVCATNIDNGYVCEQCRREYLLQRQLRSTVADGCSVQCVAAL